MYLYLYSEHLLISWWIYFPLNALGNRVELNPEQRRNNSGNCATYIDNASEQMGRLTSSDKTEREAGSVLG